MARYSRYDEGGAPPRRRRKSGGQEALWIALAIAAVLGVVMAFVISSGSSGDEEKQEARQALRTLFKTFLEGDEALGKKLIDPRQIMGELFQRRMKEWYDLSPEEKDSLRSQAWNHIRTTTILEMKLKDESLSRVDDLVLSGATVEYVPARNEVEFTWTHLGVPWRARLKQDDADRWIVFDFRQVR